MRHGSLFSGIGGFDLAAEWMGWDNVFHCEWNEFGQKVLKHYWPKAISYEDITKTDFTIHRGNIDILTGGFPCQPYSSAGKRLGKEDERHLWPEMLRAIREIKPRWVVGENVYGLVNWSGGLVFHEVQADLEAEGYEVQPYLLPAVSVNAPHRRDRIWFVAHAKSARTRSDIGGIRGVSERCDKWQEDDASFANPNNTRTNIGLPSEREWTESDGIGGLAQPELGQTGRDGDAANTNSNGQHISHSEHEINASEGRFDAQRDFEQSNGDGDATDPMCKRLEWGEERRGFGEIRKESHEFLTRCIRSKWENFPSVSPIRMRDDGVSNKLLRFVVNEFYDTISYTSQKNRIKNLQEVWERIQSQEIWEEIRGFYSLESKNVLLQTMQLYSSDWKQQRDISPFGEELCKPILQHLSKYGEFRCSPQGQELEKQRNIQFGDSLSFLPHEVALAARRFETAITKFEAWHRNESIKAGGNAVVPQVVYQIFKTIQAYEKIGI